mgnify:CR=1 FL=1
MDIVVVVVVIIIIIGLSKKKIIFLTIPTDSQVTYKHTHRDDSYMNVGHSAIVVVVMVVVIVVGIESVRFENLIIN